MILRAKQHTIDKDMVEIFSEEGGCLLFVAPVDAFLGTDFVDDLYKGREVTLIVTSE